MSKKAIQNIQHTLQSTLLKQFIIKQKWRFWQTKIWVLWV